MRPNLTYVKRVEKIVERMVSVSRAYPRLYVSRSVFMALMYLILSSSISPIVNLPSLPT